MKHQQQQPTSRLRRAVISAFIAMILTTPGHDHVSHGEASGSKRRAAVAAGR